MQKRVLVINANNWLERNVRKEFLHIFKKSVEKLEHISFVTNSSFERKYALAFHTLSEKCVFPKVSGAFFPGSIRCATSVQRRNLDELLVLFTFFGGLLLAGSTKFVYSLLIDRI